jgi:preprotein translocase subunit SecA
MDYLREGIHLRGFAQIEPIVAYKNEAFELFTDLMNSIWSDFTRMIFNVQVEVQQQVPEPAPSQTSYRSSGTSTGGGGRAVSYSSGGAPVGASAISAAAAQAAASGEPLEVLDEDGPDQLLPQPVEQRRVDENEQIGRNDPCWCGSGKKYKKCHGA